MCDLKEVRVERRVDAIFTIDVYDMCGYIVTIGNVEWSAPTIAKTGDGSWHPTQEASEPNTLRRSNEWSAPTIHVDGTKHFW